MLDPISLRPGKEQSEEFFIKGKRGTPDQKRVQYDYRHTDGKLFTCVATSLEVARGKRDKWLQDQ